MFFAQDKQTKQASKQTKNTSYTRSKLLYGSGRRKSSNLLCQLTMSKTSNCLSSLASNAHRRSTSLYVVLFGPWAGITRRSPKAMKIHIACEQIDWEGKPKIKSLLSQNRSIAVEHSTQVTIQHGRFHNCLKDSQGFSRPSTVGMCLVSSGFVQYLPKPTYKRILCAVCPCSHGSRNLPCPPCDHSPPTVPAIEASLRTKGKEIDATKAC